MKKFIQRISHDPYVDWLLIVCICLFAISVSVVWAVAVYQTATVITSTTSTASSTKPSIDMEKLESTVEIFNKKAEVFNSPTVPVIDVRDPSL